MIVYGSANNPVAPGAEDQRRHGDERIGGVQVTAEQEPRHDGAETPTGQAPLVQLVEVAGSPASREEAQHGHEDEEDENTPSATQSIMVGPSHAWRSRRRR